jgi:hypothetical protein
MADMNIKIVPDNEPNAKGKWITVERRTEHFLGWTKTEELYAPDIPEGWHAVSFNRFKIGDY